mgnify:CR=1 FL=1|jgi:protein-disulfide isomerase
MGRRNEFLLTAVCATFALVVVCWPSIDRRAVSDASIREGRGGATAAAPRETDLPAAALLTEWYTISHLIGSEAAPVRIIEFGTFTCTFCRALAAAVDTIQRRYPGLVSLRWIHYLPTDQATGATHFMAEASECIAGLSGFEGSYRMALLEGRWIDSRSGLVKASKELEGVDSNDVLACMDSREHRSQLRRHVRATASIGDVGTPAWFLNDRLLVGAVSTAQLDSLVRSEFRR